MVKAERYRNREREAREEAELEELMKTNQPTPVSPETQPPADLQPGVNWEERYGNLRRVEADLRKKIKELETAPAKPKEYPKSLEETAEWLKEYPDATGFVRTLVFQEGDGIRNEFNEKFKALETEKQQFAIDRAVTKVLGVHKDFFELKESPEFQSWVERQPAEKGKIGTAVYEAIWNNQTDGDSVIWAVNMFKAENKPKKREEKSAAETVTRSPMTTPASTDGKKRFLESEVEAMDIRTYEKFEEEIALSQSEGRFVYDLSGAAQ